MKPTEGVAEVGGFKPPRHMSALRRVSALANVAGVTDLEPALTVGEHLRERALLQRRFGSAPRGLLRSRARRRAEERELTDTALAAAGLDLVALPKGARTTVRDLERLEALRLSVALALMSGPRLLAVDDADFKLSPAERTEVWALLESVAESGTTVVAVCGEAPDDAVVVSTTGSREPGTADTRTTDRGTGDRGTGDDRDADETTGPAPDDEPDDDGRDNEGGPEDDHGPEDDGGRPDHAGPETDRPEHDDRPERDNGPKNDIRPEDDKPGDDTEGAADALAETGRS
jgi:hypothetical protein